MKKQIGLARIQVSTFMRRHYPTFLLHRLLKAPVNLKEHLSPTWVRIPESLQIDTTNYCVLKCEYCNVKEGGAFGIPRGVMPTRMVEYIIRYWGRFPEMKVIAPFVNGEPLLDKRMRYFFDYTELHSHAYNLLDTSGAVYKNRETLIHPNLKVVRFSISANSRETYRKVHGADLFDEALKTFWWLTDNKLPSQELQLHFMVTKHNEHEIDGWIERFDGYMRKIFPLHRMEGLQDDSEQSLGINKNFVIDSSSIKAWKQTRPLVVYPSGITERAPLPSYMTCQGMSFCVMWDGTLLHCSDAPPIYNYGNVRDTDMLEAWHRRNRARLTNPACIACNAKRPDWKKVIEKYVTSYE